MPNKSPDFLYKYMMQEHLDSFLEDGSIRLGTLFEFRNEEFHGSAVGDADEGKYTKAFESLETQEFDLLSDDPRAVFARQVFKGWNEFPKSVNLKIRVESNSRLELYSSSQNYFMHCTTLDYSKSGQINMGYDSCLVITDPYMFYLEISKIISGIANFEIGSIVLYSSRVGSYDKEAEIHPAFLKPSIYEYQNEFRVVWSQIDNCDIEPIVIKCPSAIQYCQVHNG